MNIPEVCFLFLFRPGGCLMKIVNRSSSGKVKSAANLSRMRASLICWVLALSLVAACAPQVSPPPPVPLYPTRVITEDGMAFLVTGFRLPGTRQELTLRFDGSKQWIDLNLLQIVRFTGPIHQGYRRAVIVLTGGERLQAEVFVNIIVEGNTDLGYWNMPLSKVQSLDLGSD